MLVVLKWLDRLVMAQRCLASLLVKRTTDPASQTSPTCQTGLPNKQKMVACEYQLSGKPLGYIVLADLADMAANMVADPDPANMDTLGECVHAKVWIMLNKLEVAHPARLLLVDQFTVMIGHAGPNILDVCVDELMRAELFVIGPYQLPSRLAKLGASLHVARQFFKPANHPANQPTSLPAIHPTSQPNKPANHNFAVHNVETYNNGFVCCTLCWFVQPRQTVAKL